MADLYKKLTKNPSLIFEIELKEDIFQKCTDAEIINQVEKSLVLIINWSQLFYGNNVINESLQCYHQLSEIQTQFDNEKKPPNSKLFNFFKDFIYYFKNQA